MGCGSSANSTLEEPTEFVIEFKPKRNTAP